MTNTLQAASCEAGTAYEKHPACTLSSGGTTSTVCGYTTFASINVLVTLEEWILGIGLKALQAFIAKRLPLAGTSREDREDLSQEILSRLHSAYGHDRKSPANWWGLLKPTIRYTAIDFLRRQLRCVKLSFGIEVEAMDCGNRATAFRTRIEMIEELHDLKKKGCIITDEDIEILVLKFYDKATLTEIARALGYKGPSSVHPKLHTAKERVIAFRVAISNVSPSVARFSQHAISAQ